MANRVVMYTDREGARFEEFIFETHPVPTETELEEAVRITRRFVSGSGYVVDLPGFVHPVSVFWITNGDAWQCVGDRTDTDFAPYQAEIDALYTLNLPVDEERQRWNVIMRRYRQHTSGCWRGPEPELIRLAHRCRATGDRKHI